MKALLLLMAVTALKPPTAVEAAIPSEPYFGRYGTVCPPVDTSGSPIMGTFRRSEGAVPQQQAALINRYVTASAAGRSTRAIFNAAQMPQETQASCAAAVAKLGNAKDCSSAQLDLLGDGEIRQVWTCNGETAYVVFYTIDAGKLTNIWAINSPPPVISR